MLVLSRKHIKYNNPKIGRTFKSILVVKARSALGSNVRPSNCPMSVECFGEEPLLLSSFFSLIELSIKVDFWRSDMRMVVFDMNEFGLGYFKV